MEHSEFDAVLILLGLSVLAVLLFRRLHLPPILAYLAVGIVAGPRVLNLIPDVQSIHLLAEVGVVFLLFAIGLELSLSQLMSMRGAMLGLGGAQVVLSAASGALIGWWIGLPWPAAVVVGGLLAMSSTAIVIKQLTEQFELQSRHGRISLGILLFQDLAVVPLLVIIPILGGGAGEAIVWPLLAALFKGALAFAILVFLGRWVFRPLFHIVASMYSLELFTLTALLVVLAAAALSDWFGLSLALGAFLAGMMLNETEYRHQIELEIRPFKDVLLGLFFVYVGLQLDVVAAARHMDHVLMLVTGLVIGKGLLIAVLARIAGNENGVALRSGLVLAQGGEFGLAALTLAVYYRLLTIDQSQSIIAAIVLSMAVAPVLIRHNGALAKRLFGRDYLKDRAGQEDALREVATPLKGHVVMCGFGRIGQNLARFLTEEGFEYVAMDLDPVLVSEAWDAGERVFYGDCAHPEILDAAGLKDARVLVVTFDEPHAAQRVVRIARARYPDMPVLVRTRDDSYLEELEAAGATEVVPETLEASMMLVTHLLARLDVPQEEILRLVEKSRHNHYQLLRGRFHGDEPELLEHPDHYHMHTVVLDKDDYAAFREIGDLGLKEIGVEVSALRRGTIRGEWPSTELELHPGDAVVLMGSPERLGQAEKLLRGGKRARRRK